MSEKKTLRFEEGNKSFNVWSKNEGLGWELSLGVDVFLDEKEIGYIGQDGSFTCGDHIIGDDSSFFAKMPLDVLKEIIAKCREFKEKCEKVAIQAPIGDSGEAKCPSCPNVFIHSMHTEKVVKCHECGTEFRVVEPIKERSNGGYFADAIGGGEGFNYPM